MKRYSYLLVLLFWCCAQLSVTSCSDDVYGDDSGIILPPKEVIEMTPVMGSWKMKTMTADVETGNAQVNEAIKQGILSNPLLQVFQTFDPTFVFGVKDDVTLNTPLGNISAGTYKFEAGVLNFHMVVSGLGAMGIPDIDQEVSLPVTASEDGNTITGTYDARPLVADQLQQLGIPVDKVKVNLVVSMIREGSEVEIITPVTGTWNLKRLVADVETGDAATNAGLKQAIEGNALLAKLMGFKPAFEFATNGKVNLIVAGFSVPAGTYTYADDGNKLIFNLVLKGLADLAGIPDVEKTLEFTVEMAEDESSFTGRMDAHFLLEGQLPAEQLDALKAAKIDLVVTMVDPKQDIPVIGKWNLKGLNADVETGDAATNAGLKQAIEGNDLLKKLVEFKPAFSFESKGEVTLNAMGVSLPAGTYGYEEGKLTLNLDLKNLSAVGIPDVKKTVEFAVTVSDDGRTLTGRMDAHFLLEGQLPAAQLEALKAAKIDLVATLEAE